MKRILNTLLWSVIAAAFIGPGTITTAARAGSDFRFALAWALLFSVAACSPPGARRWPCFIEVRPGMYGPEWAVAPLDDDRSYLEISSELDSEYEVVVNDL